MLYIGDPKNSTRKLIEMILKNTSSAVGYRLNLCKSTAVLSTINKHTKKEIVNTLLFIIASKRKKKPF